jgi:RimJ/RimL family protein N-acetyltransferase
MFDILLIPITKDNIKIYTQFEKCYDEKLSQYQSRIYPNNYIVNMETNLLNWYYIVADEKYIGSIWLEKTLEIENFAIMGIFIIDNEMRGLGLGEKAICNVVKKDMIYMHINQIILNVRSNNERAIKCYLKCGFKEIEKFKKQNDIECIKMSYTNEQNKRLC